MMDMAGTGGMKWANNNYVVDDLKTLLAAANGGQLALEADNLRWERIVYSRRAVRAMKISVLALILSI